MTWAKVFNLIVYGFAHVLWLNQNPFSFFFKDLVKIPQIIETDGLA